PRPAGVEPSPAGAARLARHHPARGLAAAARPAPVSFGLVANPGPAGRHPQVLRFPAPGPRWRLRARQRRAPAGSIVTVSPVVTMPPAAAPPTVPAPPAPPPPAPPPPAPPPPPTGHGIGLPGRQITGGWFPFRHRKGLPLPLSHCWGLGLGLGLGSGGTRFHALPKLAGRAGH